MSTTSAHPEEQLLELLLQLKKTTADEARTILNNQPQIAYALIGIMVKMNAVNVEVLQKTVAAFGSQSASAPATPAPSLLPASTPAPSNAPPAQHSSYRTPTPQAPQAPHTAYQNGYTAPGYAAPPPAAPPSANVIPDALAAIPDEQKAMIMRVVTMTPEQINQLPPADRANILQLRATLGIPS